MKCEENMKFWNKFKFYFFKYLKIHKKFKQHSINIKNYTAHPHDLVHVPAKFRENTAMRFWVTVRKLNVTDGQTDGGRCNISRPRDDIWRKLFHKNKIFLDLHCKTQINKI